MRSLQAIFVVLALALAARAEEGGAAGTGPAAAGDPRAPLDFREIIASAKARVYPTVVYVRPIVEAFGSGKREMREQGGSGFLFTEDGYAITNWHVVEKALDVRILCHDGHVAKAKVIGADKDVDVAVVKLEPRPDGKPYPTAEFSTDPVEEGDFVMAMGAPWGMSRSVSLGIVACKDRYLPGASEYSLWIQTDASISPGNSGGPLVDSSGRVVGINTRGALLGGDLGFAVPAATVKRIAASLVKHGVVKRAWTGLRLQPLRDFERNTFFDGDQGVLVASVDEGSPAAAAGLMAGDLLLTAGGTALRGLTHEHLPAINQLLADLEPDRAVEVAYEREREARKTALTPREKGKVEGDDFECKTWNMTVKAINEFKDPELYFFQKRGVYVQGVRQPGNAAASGLRRHDILLKVDGRPIATLDELKAAYEAVIASAPEGRKKVAVEVLRAGLSRQLVLDFSTTYKED